MASPTTNKGYTYPAHNGAINSWDTPIDANFDQIDLNVGGPYQVICGSSIAGATFNSTNATISSTVNTATFPSSIAQNLYYNVTGALTKDLTLQFPAVGGLYSVNNQTTGGFNLFVNTQAGGSTAVSVFGSQPFVTDSVNPVFLPSPAVRGVGCWQDQKTSSASGGSAASGAWTTRTLNTQVFNNIGATLLTTINAVNLIPGTYYVEWWSTYFGTDAVTSQLTNLSDNATAGSGAPIAGASENLRAPGATSFTITTAKNYAIQYWSISAVSGNGLGIGWSSLGGTSPEGAFTVTNVYSNLSVWKLA